MLQKSTSIKSAAFFLSLIILLQFGCKKNDDISSNPPLEPPVVSNDAVKVTATVTGSVLDENNQPVANAIVTADTYTASTDAMGNFVLSNINISKANGHVTVIKQGYFKGIRSFVTAAGKNNYVKIQLIKQVVTGTVAAASGGVVNTLTGASITFPANAFVTAGGAPYTGTVFVMAHWIDPTAANLPLVVPGDLRGIDSSNGEYILKSYGMLGAEFQDNSGNTLKLAAGKKATISFPIPASLQSTAPATIPLWHFDETAARWKQEGTATKSGNNYIGQVDKFSFWNVDVPGNFVTLDLRLINSANNLPLANTMVKITSAGTNTSAYGFTNDSGYVSGYVPKNENLKLEVFAGTSCNTNTIIHTQNIGPYTANASLGNISVTLPVNLSINFTGLVKNCNNQPVTNGYISLRLANGNSAIAYTDAAGAVNFSIIHCGGSQTYTYNAVDLSNGNYSTTATGTASGNSVNLGTVTACGNAINVSGVYITGSIDNNAVLWKDGVPAFLTNLPSGSVYHFAYATKALVYNNDVYVLVTEEDSTVNGFISTVKIWKNGTLTNITNGTEYTEAYGLDVYNGDVYMCGNVQTGNTATAKIWKNGTATTLAKDTFDNIYAYSIKIYNGDVYVSGYGTKFMPGSFSPDDKPLFWKNGVINVLPAANGQGSAEGLFISNGDIYISGTEDLFSSSSSSRAVYWKNGIKTSLPLTGNYTHSSANLIFADNGDVYTGGNLNWYSQAYYSSNAAIWKNNTVTELTSYTTPGIHTDLYGIFVKNNIVYTVGETYQNNSNLPSTYLYFQNSIPVALTGFNSSQEVYLSSIFVK